jgi:N-acetylated-alpha-linked acidic dipeptidase
MKILKPLLSLSLLTTVSFGLEAQQLDGFFQKSQSKEKTIEQEYLNAVKFDRFKVHLKELTKAPHIAGTPENEAVAAYMTKVMSDAGMEVKTHPYDVYLPNDPGESLLQIISPETMTLSQQEGPIPGD